MKQDFYTKVQQIDNVLSLDKVKPSLANPVVVLIADDKSLRDYYFKRVKSVQWFDILKREKYFDVNYENIQFDNNDNALFWNVLDYLERVSEQISQDLQYGKELIEIIDLVVKFSLNEKRVNNYYIWWYCVKILNNLPPKIIQDNLPTDKFQTWLSVWTDNSLEGDLAISDISIKLLPKFLKEEFAPDYEYAEEIINVITDIKGEDNKSRTVKRGKAVLVWSSYWVREAFRKYGKLIGEKCSVEVIFNLADKLKRTLQYKQEECYAYIDIGENVYKICVAKQPVEGLKAGQIDYEDNHYECVTKQFAEDQLKGIDRENDFWALSNIEPQIECGRFQFAALKGSFFAEIKRNLPEDIKWQSVDNLERKLSDIYEGLYSDYSHIWCTDLNSGPEYGDSAKEVLTVILRDVLLANCEANREAGRKILNTFLDDRYQFSIFRRFVLLCADKFWDTYSGFLDKLIKIIPNILEEGDFEVEMQDILEHHSSVFTPDNPLTKRLEELINNVPEYYIKRGDKLSAYRKYKWLSPLKDNPYFSNLYKEAKQGAELKEDKPYMSDRKAFKGGLVKYNSSLSKEELLQKPILEIVNFLEEFKEDEDQWQIRFEGSPSKQGLAEVLKDAVKDSPKKFTDGLDAFLKVDYLYLHGIIRGLNDVWNSNKEMEWENILTFGVKYFGRSKEIILEEVLAAQGEDSGNGKHIWVVENFVDLIADGCRNDDHAFNPEYFELANKIFELIFPLLKGEKQPDMQRDALNYSLNTTLGRTIMAYVSFSLRVARATGKKIENWGDKNYERFYGIGIDAYTLFGSYLPQMKYLDEKYTKEKIEYFEKESVNSFEWKMFMEGYLNRARIYSDIYKFMRQNYIKCLENKVLDENTDKRLVEHICIGYLYGDELLQLKNNNGKYSLFLKILTEAKKIGKPERWLWVVEYFWSMSGRRVKKEDKNAEKNMAEEKKKMLKFWEWVFDNLNIVKDNLGKEHNSFLGRMTELTILLDKIDAKEEKRLLLCAPYIDFRYHATFFIEYLAKFDDKESVEHIGRIYRKVLENNTPTFRQEDIESIVRKIYKKGKRKDAEDICNTYGRRGIHFLKAVWEEFQTK